MRWSDEEIQAALDHEDAKRDAYMEQAEDALYEYDQREARGERGWTL